MLGKNDRECLLISESSDSEALQLLLTNNWTEVGLVYIDKRGSLETGLGELKTRLVVLCALAPHAPPTELWEHRIG